MRPKLGNLSTCMLVSPSRCAAVIYLVLPQSCPAYQDAASVPTVLAR